MAILCQKMKPIRQKELPTPSKQVSSYIIIKNISSLYQQFIINRIEKKRYICYFICYLMSSLIMYIEPVNISIYTVRK